ncbi:MAG: bifunctional diguanylate cyclase/phosphodiesterase [Cyanobacteria bacterium J06641_5]
MYGVDEQHQSLPGPLLSRSLLLQQLDELLAVSVSGQRESLAILILNLDRFRHVNHLFGQQGGDRILALLQQRLQQHCQPDENLLADWGGARFAIVQRLARVNGAQMEAVCARWGAVIRQPIILNNHQVCLTATVGAALSPYDGCHAEELLLNAETALQVAKQQGKGTHATYSPLLQAEHNPLLLETELRSAIACDGLELHYQPQVDLVSGQVAALEALARWQHPVRSLLTSSQFIPLAEESDLICELGDWALRQACQQLACWHRAGWHELKIAVNISTRQFSRAGFVETVAAVLAKTGIPAASLEIEITETTAAQDVVLAARVMQELNALGVGIAIDDFGTGHSSLAAVQHFPIQTLKIDRTFVAAAFDNPVNTAVMEAILTLGRGLDAIVVAEGIETASQMEFVQSLNCDRGQGFLLGRPLSAAATTAYLERSPQTLSGLPRTIPIPASLSTYYPYH